MEFIKAPIVLICALMAALVLRPTCAANRPKDYLDAHNPSRAELGIPPLVWDLKLSAYAKNYAKQRSKDCNMIHSMGPYGENLSGSEGDLSAKAAVDLWTEEKKNYDVANNKCVAEGYDSECRHYTQVVSRRSERVGCAKTKCDNGGTFVICSYDPPGNIIGQRPF